MTRHIKLLSRLENALNVEAERYVALAEKAALKNLLKPDPKEERRARQHAVWAEATYAAAFLVGRFESSAAVSEGRGQ